MSDDTLRMTITRANDMRSWAQGKGGLFEVFDAIHNNYVAEITDSDPTEPAIREAAYHRIKALADLRKAMELVMTEGANAVAILNKKSQTEAMRKSKNVA